MMYFESWEEHFRKYGYGTSDLLSLLRDHGFEIGVPENYRSDRNENLLRAHKLVLDTASFTMGASSQADRSTNNSRQAKGEEPYCMEALYGR
jgi:hypothetical protein